jgi:hypothetical protein
MESRSRAGALRLVRLGNDLYPQALLAHDPSTPHQTVAFEIVEGPVDGRPGLPAERSGGCGFVQSDHVPSTTRRLPEIGQQFAPLEGGAAGATLRMLFAHLRYIGAILSQINIADIRYMPTMQATNSGS